MASDGARPLPVGMVGSGFMGLCHANAFRSVAGLFPLGRTPILDIVADANDDLAASAAHRLGFARHTGDWQDLVSDPDVDLISVTAPNALHELIAIAALAAGKPVCCEKPLASAAACAHLTDAAEKASQYYSYA